MPTPMMSQYASWELVGDFEFAQMATTAAGVLPPGPWELTPATQLMDSGGSISASLIQVVNGVGLVMQVGGQEVGTGIDSYPGPNSGGYNGNTPQGGFGVKTPYYREIQCTLPAVSGRLVNHPSSWTLTTRQGDDATIYGEVDVTEGGYNGNLGVPENKGTIHNGSTSQFSDAGPDMGVTLGLNTYAVFNDGTHVTWYLNGSQITNPGSGYNNPATFPTVVPADTIWFPLHCNIPAGGMFSTNAATVTGASGEYIVAYDRWYIDSTGGPAFTADSPPTTSVVGTTYSYTFAASGATSFAHTGSIPTGLTFSTTTGLLSGTPSVAGTYNFTVTATSSAGTTTGSANSITVTSTAGAAPVFTVDSPPNATLNTAYSYQFAATGSPAPTFSLQSGFLPLGANTLNATTGLLSGTPSAAGTYSFVIKATNANGSASTSTLEIVVSTTATGGTITRVQWGDWGGANSGQTITPVFNGLSVNDVAANNSVLLTFDVYGADSIASVTTTFGTASKVNSTSTSFVGEQEIWQVVSASGGGNQITATTTSGSQFSLHFSEWASAGAATDGGNAAPTTANPSLTVSPGAAGSLVLVSYMSAGAASAGPASPAVDYNSGALLFSSGQDVAYEITTSASAVTIAWTEAANYAGMLGVYIAAASGASAAGRSAFHFTGTGAIVASLVGTASFHFTGVGFATQLAIIGESNFEFSATADLIGFQPESPGTVQIGVPRFPAITVEVT